MGQNQGVGFLRGITSRSGNVAFGRSDTLEAAASGGFGGDGGVTRSSGDSFGNTASTAGSVHRSPVDNAVPRVQVQRQYILLVLTVSCSQKLVGVNQLSRMFAIQRAHMLYWNRCATVRHCHMVKIQASRLRRQGPCGRFLRIPPVLLPWRRQVRSDFVDI